MGITDRHQNFIDRIRYPANQGRSRQTVHMLRHSLVELDYLRRSIDDARLQVDRSWDAVRESKMLLRRLRGQGF